MKKAIAIFLLCLTVGAADLKLRWDSNDPRDAVIRYNVYMRNNFSVIAPFVRIAATTNNTWAFTNIPPGNYSFHVTATNSAGESTPSNTVSTNMTTAVPRAPANLGFTP